MDDELLQDFLVEAGEILEQLDEQLVSLEQQPDDMDMLNAVFRGFHTIKGGAGFLGIEPMVQLCHRSEDIFNLLRNGERTITPELMDAVLPVLDVLREQFETLSAGDMPGDADPAMLSALERYTVPESADAPAPAEPAPAETPAAEQKTGGDDDITDEEFEALLDALENPDAATEKSDGQEAASDEITEDEFEALLDQIHGKGQFKPDAVKAREGAETPTAGTGAADSDEITEDEFEALLDQIHGKGQFKPDAVKAGGEEPADKPKPPAPVEPAAEQPKPASGEVLPKKTAGKGSPRRARKSPRPRPRCGWTRRASTRS